jgi:hypothetical protein
VFDDREGNYMKASQSTGLFILALLVAPRSDSARQEHLLALSLRPLPARDLAWLGIRNMTKEPQSLCISESSFEIASPTGDPLTIGSSEPSSPHGSQCKVDLSSWRLVLPGESAFFLRGDPALPTSRPASRHLKVSVLVFVNMDDYLGGTVRSELLRAEAALPER